MLIIGDGIVSQKDETLEYLLKVMPGLKDYKTDMALDLLKIFDDRAKRFKDEVDSESLSIINRHIEELKSYIMAPRMKNKLYIIIGLENITMITLGLSDWEVHQIKEICDNGSQFDDIPMEHIVSLYIYDKERQVFKSDLYPEEMSAFVKYFHYKNLIKDYDINEYDKFHLF